VNDLDIEGLVGGVLRGVLGGRGKRSHGTLRYLTGGGQSSFLNASTLLAVAGVAWGLWETAQQQSSGGTQQSWGGTSWGGTSRKAGDVPAYGTPPPLPQSGLNVPPPVPPDMAPVAMVIPPPLPQSAPQSRGGTSRNAGDVPPYKAGDVPPYTVQPEVLRVLRLTLAAARADGTLEPRERDAILARAKEVGAEPLIAAEVDRPKDLGEIVGEVEDQRMRQDLYTLAYAIVRADEQVSDRERSWLTELAGHLRVDAGTVAGLEQQAAARIAAAAHGAPH
jgi:tellurite resistance protein